MVNGLISHIFVPGNCVIVLGQSNFCKEWLLCSHSSYNYQVVSVAQAVLVTVSLNLEAFLRWSAGQLGHLIYAELVGPGSQLLYLQWCRSGQMQVKGVHVLLILGNEEFTHF